MKRFLTSSLVLGVTLALIILSGCVRQVDSVKFNFNLNEFTNAQQIHVRYASGGGNHTTADLSGLDTVTISTYGETVIGGYVTDGDISWVPAVNYGSGVMEINNLKVGEVTLSNVNITNYKPTFAVDHVELVRPPEYYGEGEAEELISVSFAVYGTDGNLVSGQTEVYTYHPELIFHSWDNTSSEVLHRFSSHTVNGIVTFLIESTLDIVNSEAIQLWSGDDLIFDSLINPDFESLVLEFATGDSENNVTQNVILPTSDIPNTSIAWSSSHPEVVSSSGMVNPPTHGSGDVNVTLTGIVNYNEQYYTTLTFNLVVKEAEAEIIPVVPVVVAPMASPAAGEVASGTSVTLSSTTLDADIYYTVDGSTPTASSTLYSIPIIVSNAQTIKAIAIHEGMIDSDIFSGSYTITPIVIEEEDTQADDEEDQPEPQPQSKVSDMNGDSGGEVTSEHVGIMFPSNAFTGQFKVTITPVTDVSGLVTNPNSTIVGNVISITKNRTGSFNTPVTITLNVDVTNIDSEHYDYAVYWYDEEVEQWVILDNVKVNLATGEVSGDVNHFTMFTVLATKKVVIVEEPIPTKKVLTDIQGHWAEKSIQQLVDLGAIAGYPDSSFLPDNTITRAEFVQMLVKALALKQQGTQVFEDTKGHWAEHSIATAIANGIVSGFDADHFGPDVRITREQIASMVMRAAQLTAGTENLLFTDQAEISVWARASVATLTRDGIIAGYTDGSFRPLQSATRAEAVTIVLNILR